MEHLAGLMTSEVNSIKIPHYVGDLLHDGMFIMRVGKPGTKFLWALKENGCGTYIGIEPNKAELTSNDIDAAYLLRNEYAHVYRLTIESLDSNGYPRGTIEILKGGAVDLELKRKAQNI